MLRPVDTPPAMGNSALAHALDFFVLFFLRCKHSWLQLKIQGPDQPPKPTGYPHPRSRPLASFCLGLLI